MQIKIWHESQGMPTVLDMPAGEMVYLHWYIGMKEWYCYIYPDGTAHVFQPKKKEMK